MALSRNQIIAIVAVVVIIIIAIAAFALSNSDDNDSKDNNDDDNGAGANAGKSTNDPNKFDHLETALWVYGNADNDSDLDTDDVKFIQDIIDGKSTWNPATNPYADANYDGVIDSNDVKYLNTILSKKTCNLYYDQFWSAGGASPWEVSYIHYPYSDKTKYGINYWEQADVMVLLDMWGQVTASESVVCMGDNYASKYPGVTSMFKLGALATMDYETVVKSGIDCLIGYVAADGTAHQIQDDLRNAGLDIDVIALPMSGVYCCKAVTTMGVLLGCEDNAKKYTDYNDAIVEYMDKNITQNKSITPASYVVVYSPKDPTRIEIEATNESTGMPCGGIAFIQLLPGNNIQKYGDSGSAYAYRSDEWFVTQNPDYIIISGATKTSASTHAEAEEQFKEYADVFKATGAYSKGNIIGCAYSMTTGYSAYASLVMMAVYMYPDAFTEADENYAWSVLQQWYDDFTYQKIDVKEVGGHVTKLGNE